jgi:hypothetical protein
MKKEHEISKTSTNKQANKFSNSNYFKNHEKTKK